MISSFTMDQIGQRYEGMYDPCAVFTQLRSDNVLGQYSYLHLGRQGAELGWAPIEHLALLKGEECKEWRGKLSAFAHKAKQLGRKAVGYVGFDAIDCSSGTLPDWSTSNQPLVEFIIPGEVVAITPSYVEHIGTESLRLESYLSTRTLNTDKKVSSSPRLVGQTSESDYISMVSRVLKAINRGRIEKAVLSRYEAYETDFEPVSVLSTLAAPQTGSFLLCFGDLTAIVPSPELLLAAKDRRVITNPLAGTRRCGASAIEDRRFRDELQSNHKEIVEHMLAVRTIFSELESVCDPETLCISRLMDIARHKNVQHLSSVLRGTLVENLTALDALWALFPSVTVTGTPKPAALTELRALESNPRYLYSGAIGWVSGSDDCEFMLAIRSVFRHRDRTFLHAGAGIIAESCPHSELIETRHKLSAMKDAIFGNEL